jgi:periplasmic protein CpxP/Spy
MSKSALAGILGVLIIQLGVLPVSLAAEASGMGVVIPWSERHENAEIRNQPSYGDVILRQADELQLSDEQLGKIVRIHRANQQRVLEIVGRLHETRRSDYALFLNPASSETEVRQAAKAHAAAFDELVETTLKSRKQINDVLTPEQTNKLATRRVIP